MHEENLFTIWIHIHIFLFTICLSGALRDQKNASDLQDLEIQEALTNLRWVLGIKFGYPRGEVLQSQLSMCLICHYNMEDEEVTVLLLSPIT